MVSLTTPTSIYSAPIIEKVAEYLHYYHQNKDKENVPDLDIPVELCLVVVQAADYFGLVSKALNAP
jgi:hypothetical protein